MPVSFADLERRTLLTKIEIDNQGTKEDFRIVFRDVSKAENKRLRLEAAEELEKLTEPIITLQSEVATGYDQIAKAREDIAKLAGKNGDSPKRVKELEKQIAKQEKEIREKEKRIIQTPIPSFQELYLSRIVTKLPDFVDKGVVVEPTVENLQRIPQNMLLGMDMAISRRIGEVDPK